MKSRRSEFALFFSAGVAGVSRIRTMDSRSKSACFLPGTSPDVAPGKQPGATFLSAGGSQVACRCLHRSGEPKPC